MRKGLLICGVVSMVAGCGGTRVMVGDGPVPPEGFGAYPLLGLSPTSECLEISGYLWIRPLPGEANVSAPVCLVDESGNNFLMRPTFSSYPWQELGWSACMDSPAIFSLPLCEGVVWE